MYEQLRPLRNGHTREEVVRSQRGRLFGAMIATVAERGYDASTVNELRARAGVSKCTVYDHFPSKEAYFLGTYDLVAYRALKRVQDAYASAQDREERMRAAFRAIAGELSGHPDAMRLALVVAPGAGRGALVRCERAARAFEQGLLLALEDRSHRGAPDPLLVKGLVGGVVWVLRLNLASATRAGGDLRGSSVIAEELCGWVTSYHWPVSWGAAADLDSAVSGLRRSDADVQALRRSLSDGRGHGLDADRAPGLDRDPALRRGKVLRGALRAAARGGCENLSVARIMEEAGCSYEAFFACFEDCQSCVFEAVREGAREGVQRVRAACADACDWADAVRLGARALMEYLADRPELARVACAEALMLGREGVEHSIALVDELALLLADALPAARHDSGLAVNSPERTVLLARALVGAGWEMVGHYVAREQIQALPEAANRLIYLVLAPAIGSQEAIELILRTHGAEVESELQQIVNRGFSPITHKPALR